MTCIIGVEHGGNVYMGADSITLNGWAKDIIAGSKLFKRNGMLFGCAGSPRMAQILQHHMQIDRAQGAMTDEAYLVTVVVAAARKAFNEHGFTETENGRELGGIFLLGYNGKLYSVEGGFQLCRSSRKIAAIGAGDDYAMGALYALMYQYEHSVWDEEFIRSAITNGLIVAEKLSSAVSGPFMIEVLETPTIPLPKLMERYTI